ncbi:type II toxin-antitoxin system VapC family toxin [Kyrpidia tusciae]|uniref:PilT protein domain protein n=1 Tax=Kyrpidia tusciae (strain DSM 2912 / NBRC 15312 / T2) TaxID=562970 RepID=D5WT52_KYRT2|nr:type II toxin-antitoxin system VapC family toxin [Kyrpidia tusciae]ADG05156.1 PilT protein domain protein [Kyrpidia tusciae DSM 2912]
MPFVLDASMALSWCFPEEGSEKNDAILQRRAWDPGIVPAIWSMEVGNALLTAGRRGRLTDAERREAADLLAHLGIEVEPASTGHILLHVLPVAAQYELSIYDAAYLEMALRKHLPLAAADQKLAQAAATDGVELLTPV